MLMEELRSVRTPFSRRIYQPPATTHKLLRCGHVFDSVGDNLRNDVDILVSGEMIQKVRTSLASSHLHW